MQYCLEEKIGQRSSEAQSEDEAVEEVHAVLTRWQKALKAAPILGLR